MAKGLPTRFSPKQVSQAASGDLLQYNQYGNTGGRGAATQWECHETLQQGFSPEVFSGHQVRERQGEHGRNKRG